MNNNKGSFATRPIGFNVHVYNVMGSMLELSMLYAFKAALDVMFLRFVLPFFSYQPHFGLYGPPDFSRLMISYLLLPVLWLSIRPIFASSGRPFSKVVIGTQFFVVVLPAFTIWVQEARPISHLGLILLGFYALIAVVLLVPKVSFPPLGPSLIVPFLAVAALAEIYVYAGLIAGGGLQRLNFNLLNVYKVRGMYLQHIFPLAGRLVPWIGNVFNPALFIYSLHTRRAVLGILALLLQLLLFSMTNFKSYLFMLLIIYVIWYTASKLEFSLAIVLGAVGSALLTVPVIFLGNVFLVGSLFRRAYFVPPALQGLYFDYFSRHAHAYMSGSTFGKFLELLGVQLPYTSSPVQVVANAYWGGGISPNVGWIGAAFSDLGIWGIVLTAVLLGLVVAMGDSFSKLYHTRGFIEAMAFSFAFSLTNSAFMTAFFTHGGFMSLFVLWVVQSITRRRERRVDE